MIVDPLFYLVAIPAVVLAGISKGGFGGGVAMISVPLMSLVISPLLATAIMAPILCTIDLYSAWAYWGKWDTRKVMLLVGGALIGVAIGTMTFEYLNPDIIRIMIGVIAITFAIYYLYLQKLATQQAASDNFLKGAICGVIAGFISFTTHAGGPPLHLYLLPMKLPRTVYHATTVGFFVSINGAKLIPYTWLGLFTHEVLTTALVLGPLALAAAFFGAWAHKRMSDRLFYAVCQWALLFTGFKLLYDGFSALI